MYILDKANVIKSSCNPQRS